MLGLFSFSEEYSGEYEVGYIGMEINKLVKSEFFPVYMDYENEQPYIGLVSFFSFIGAADMKVDIKKMSATGRIGEEAFNIDIKGTTYLVGENEIFIKADDYGILFEVEKIEWDVERYNFIMELSFETPYEIYLESQKRISGIGTEEDEEVDPEMIYTMEKKLFSPGVLKLRYFNFDVSDSDYSLSTRYDTSFLYGDFTMNYFFEPSGELSNIRLQYTDLIEEKRVVFGDFFTRTYNFLNTSRVRGASVDRWDPDGEIELSRTEIKGFASYRSTVELYRNGSLIDFVVVDQDGSYVFEDIRIQSITDTYQVKIYTYEGTIETRDISLYSNRRIQEKGEFDYDLMVGQSPDKDLENRDETQHIAKGYYGITDRLTLGLGHMNVVSRVRDENDFFESDLVDDDDDDDERATVVNSLVDTSIYYSTPPIKYPIYIEMTNLHDTDEGENTQVGIYRQRFGPNLLTAEGYIYGDKMSRVTDYENEYELIWRGPINNRWRYSLSYNQFGERTGDETQLVFGELFYNTEKTSHTLGLAHVISSEDRDGPIATYSYTHSGVEIFKIPMILNLRARVDTGNASEDALYGAGLTRRGGERVDFSLRADYDTEDFFITMTVEYKLTNWMELLGSVTRDDEETDAFLGVDIEKTIILEKPFEKHSNPEPDRSWMEGQVFTDTDGDGEKDSDEQSLEGVRLTVSGKEGFTDEEGKYFIDDISSYSLEELKVDGTTLDPMVKSNQEKTHLRLYPARGGELDIPLQPISVITGYIEFDYEGFSEVESYPLKSNLYIILKDQNGEILKEQRMEPEGFYLIEEVLPGKYIVSLDYRGDKNITLDREFVNLEVLAGEYGDYYSGNDFRIIQVEEE